MSNKNSYNDDIIIGKALNYFWQKLKDKFVTREAVTKEVNAAIDRLFDGDIPSGGGGSSPLPNVTSKDEGKVLTVVDGEWAAARLPVYDGTYEITPSAESKQTLKTANALMDADVVVKKIPYAEVTNTSNGTTVTIG